MSSNSQTNVQQIVRILQEAATLIGEKREETIILEDNPIMPGLGMIHDATLLEQRLQRLEQNLFNIVVVGSFSNGKSTLLNALLGSDLLPTRATPTTAVITRMVFGAVEKIEVFEINQAQPRTVTWDEYVAEFSLTDNDLFTIEEENQPPNRFQRIAYVQITQPYPLLRDGISIVDTPGLDEHYSRTRVVLDHLPTAQAIIFVLDATAMLRRSERDFIRMLSPGRTDHLFFVINRINNVPSKEHPKLEAWFRAAMQAYFVDKNDDFDETFYQSRVFWVDALKALEARIQTPTKQLAVNESGIADFEQTLTTFLHSSQRQQASLQTTARHLMDIMYRIQEQLRLYRDLYAQPLDVLEARHKQIQQRLEALSHIEARLLELLDQLGDTIKYQVYADLMQYVGQMQNSWRTDAVQHLELKSLENTNFFKTAFSKQEQAHFSKVLENEIRTYLEIKLNQWAQHVPAVIQPGLETLLDQIEREFSLYQTELVAVSSVLVTAVASQGQATIRQRSLARQTLSDLGIEPIAGESIKSSLYENLDINRVVQHLTVWLNTTMTGSDWIRIAVSAVFQAMQLIAYSTGPLFVRLAMIAGSQVLAYFKRDLEQPTNQIKSQIDSQYSYLPSEAIKVLQEHIRNKLVGHLEDSLFVRFRDEIGQRREEIYRYIDQEFEGLKTNLRQQWQKQVEQVRREQDDLLNVRQDSNFVIQQELIRLGAIETAVQARFDQICDLAYDRRFSAAEIKAMGQGQAVFMSGQGDMPQVESLVTITLPEEQPAPAAFVKDVSGLQVRLQNAVVYALGLDPTTQSTAQPTLDNEIAQLSGKLARLIGLQEVKEVVLELMYFQAEEKRRREAKQSSQDALPSLHMVFTGNPGTGKTTVAEIIGEIYQKIGLLPHGRVISISKKDLIGPYVGWTEQITKDVIEKSLGGVLFIDEAYALVEEKHTTYNLGRRIIEILLEYMEKERHRLAIIVAGYPKEMQGFLDLNPGLSSRFPKQNVIHFPDYTPPELMQILQKMIAEKEYTLAPSTIATLQGILEGMYIQRDKNFGNARDMRDLAESLIRRRSLRIHKANLPSDDPIQPEDISPRYHDYALRVEDDPAKILREFDHLIGLESVKVFVKRMVAQVRVAQRLGHKADLESMHMVFKGNPGTGKTTVAELMGRVFQALGFLRRGTVFKVERADLVAEHVGQTAPKTLETIAKAMDAILFIDEAYSLIPGSGNDFGHEAIDTLVKSMEEHRDRIVVIAAGYPQEMEAFLDTNPGLSSRFRYHIDFQDYNQDQMIEILRTMATKRSYILTPGAEARASKYLKEVRQQNPHRFSNARTARNLLDDMIGRAAERASQFLDKLDDDQFRQVATMLQVEDVPDIPIVETKSEQAKLIATSAVRGKIISLDTKVAELDIQIKPPAAERSR